MYGMRHEAKTCLFRVNVPKHVHTTAKCELFLLQRQIPNSSDFTHLYMEKNHTCTLSYHVYCFGPSVHKLQL